MGKAGMKRKGRNHLPKVGTRPANEALLHERRTHALNPFSTGPSGQGGTGFAILAAVLAVAVVIAIVALIALD